MINADVIAHEMAGVNVEAFRVAIFCSILVNRNAGASAFGSAEKLASSLFQEMFFMPQNG